MVDGDEDWEPLNELDAEVPEAPKSVMVKLKAAGEVGEAVLEAPVSDPVVFVVAWGPISFWLAAAQ